MMSLHAEASGDEGDRGDGGAASDGSAEVDSDLSFQTHVMKVIDKHFFCRFEAPTWRYCMWPVGL